jgi:3-dehydroquinate dehydratase-1
MNYKTCVSVAESTPVKLNQMLRTALKKSDYAEIRFDFLEPKRIPEAIELTKKKLARTVCTLRPKIEGGNFSGSEKERISILKLIAEYEPFLLDIELNTIRNNKELRNYLKKTKTKILVSWHDFKKTPDLKTLQKNFEQMRKYSNYIKIVTNAKKESDSAHVLALYSKAANTKLIAFSMGNLGRMSRILCLYLGSPFTYVTLGNPIASGQFSLKEVQKIVAPK